MMNRSSYSDVTPLPGSPKTRNVLVRESISEAWVACVQVRLTIKGGLH